MDVPGNCFKHDIHRDDWKAHKSKLTLDAPVATTIIIWQSQSFPSYRTNNIREQSRGRTCARIPKTVLNSIFPTSPPHRIEKNVVLSALSLPGQIISFALLVRYLPRQRGILVAPVAGMLPLLSSSDDEFMMRSQSVVYFGLFLLLGPWTSSI